MGAVSGDDHIGPAPAAVDRRVNAGGPRLGIPDLGTDEYGAPGALRTTYLPLVLRNGPQCPRRHRDDRVFAARVSVANLWRRLRGRMPHLSTLGGPGAAKTCVGIDIGSADIRTIVGEKLGNRAPRIIAAGRAPYGGLRKGTAVDGGQATDAIGASVKQVEKTLGHRFVSASVGISGAQVSRIAVARITWFT